MEQQQFPDVQYTPLPPQPLRPQQRPLPATPQVPTMTTPVIQPIQPIVRAPFNPQGERLQQQLHEAMQRERLQQQQLPVLRQDLKLQNFNPPLKIVTNPDKVTNLVYGQDLRIFNKLTSKLAVIGVLVLLLAVCGILIYMLTTQSNSVGLWGAIATLAVFSVIFTVVALVTWPKSLFFVHCQSLTKQNEINYQNEFGLMHPFKKDLPNYNYGRLD